jgi:hypothetical protein
MTETWAPLRVKLFMWLALRGRQWTADRQRRHGLEANDHCFLYDQQAETIDHIVITYSFSQQIWWNVTMALRNTGGDRDVCIHPGMVGNLEAALDWVRAKGS